MAEAGRDGDEDGEETGGPTPVELITFLLKAPSRRKKLARIVFGATALAGIAVAVVKPPSYISEVKILSQRSSGKVKEVATNSTREDAPTRSVSESILRRDNLISIVEETKLLERWSQDRAPLLRLKDRIMGLVGGPLSEADKRRAIVGVLEQKLYVNADDTTITIGVIWPTAQTAFEIVNAAQQGFLDARQESEVKMISDAIDILESHLKTERDNLDAAVVDLQRLEDIKKNGGDVAVATAPSSSASADPSVPPPKKKHHASRPATPAGPDPELKKALADKQKEVEDLESARQRKLADFNSQLTSMRATLAPAHPSIVALEREIESVNRPTPEVTALKAEVAQLQAQVGDATPAAAMNNGGDPTVSSSEGRDGGSPIVVVERNEDDASTALAKQKLTNETLKCDELQSRIRAARIELDVAEAAFKYKYTIITPAEVPREAKKPSPALIGLLGFVVGFVLYFLIPAALDLLSGRIIASWQARKLGIPLLAEVDPPEV